MTTIQLSGAQVVGLEKLLLEKNYPAAYGFLGGVVNQEILVTTDDVVKDELKVLSNWLEAARSINSNDRSFFSDMVRGSMRFAVGTTGRNLTDAQFQDASDALARQVIGRIVKDNSVSPVAEILDEDVLSLVTELGLKRHHWAGAVADKLPIALKGLGQDFVQIPGEGLEYMLNISVAGLQVMAGLSQFLDRDSIFDHSPTWRLIREINKEWSGALFRYIDSENGAQIDPPNNLRHFITKSLSPCHVNLSLVSN